MNEVEKWLGHDPAEVALKTGDRFLAERVDLLQRARAKIPSYFECRAEFSRIALEQCTSEAVAASRNYRGGRLAVDLTTGLGVDSLYLSKSYAKVISVEADEGRARDAAANFALLGAGNVSVVNSTAEEFLKGFGDVADLVFIDPARRDGDGNRIYDIRKTSPDVVSLLPEIRSRCRNLVIKCSPMFDVAELHRIFGPDYSVETVSLDGECKETVIRYDGTIGRNMVTVISSSGSTVRMDFPFDSLERAMGMDFGDARWISMFDPAIVKARVADNLMAVFFPDTECMTAGSYILTSQRLSMEGVIQCRRILSAQPYKPAKLRKELAGRGYDVYRKGFPVPMDVMKKQLGIREGGKDALAFVQVDGERYMLSLEASQ